MLLNGITDSGRPDAVNLEILGSISTPQEL